MSKKVYVDSKELFSLVRGCLKFPYPTICRHLVALDLIDVLERSGYKMPDGLVEAISKADDFTAENILIEKI